MADFTIPKTYDFRTVEERLYKWWEESGYFKPRSDAASKPFVISMPPPNVTGELHLGHAMFVAMEDLMTRISRMRGDPALWLPGSDHAGIATQLLVEKDLLEHEGLTREAIGREAFVKRTWAWKEKYGGIITRQLRRLGASCDWGRERFTLDEGLSRAVREAFVRLYEKGLIYRGTYLINWSPGLRTAVSDLEVEYSEEEATLYYFKYPIAGSNEYIPVATTRPETILGDTAVAVHPDDERYRHLIGKTCLVPILKRTIPVIHDTYVDREFATGALKITPGHDPADYEIAQRHGLPVISVLNPDATMSSEAGPYAGLDRYECRKRIWKDMEAAGLTIKTEPYLMQVPRSQRGGEIVEPMVSTQWFVRMGPLAEAGLKAVRDGQIRIVPERFAKVYFNWLENIRDWCISRQLWWGHRIPAWYCADCGKITVARQDPDRCAHCDSAKIEQDPDVLDTWFSSGLWPFSTLGWPEDTPDLRTYYPTSVMETGYDILFFWVARMIMMGLEFTGKAPFHTVYLHGLVRDEHGRKMSKTLGNVIDPLQVMDEYGTDALRFTLLTGSSPGNDLNLSLERVEGNRNFANKLWNATRLVLSALERAKGPGGSHPERTLADRWIIARLEAVKRETDRLLGACQYGEVGRQVYDFFWGEYADWYLEIAKLQLEENPGRAWQTAGIMAKVLDNCLRLLHPYTPFVTEELWGRLKAACQARNGVYEPQGGWEEALILARWPETGEGEPKAGPETGDFVPFIEFVRKIRNERVEWNIEPASRMRAIFAYNAEHMPAYVRGELANLLSRLARVDVDTEVVRKLPIRPRNALYVAAGRFQVYLLTDGLVDAGAARNRIQKDMECTQKQIERLEGLLAGPFAERAPMDVVQRERDKLVALHETLDRLRGQLHVLD